jgi:hypothetical protein
VLAFFITAAVIRTLTLEQSLSTAIDNPRIHHQLLPDLVVNEGEVHAGDPPNWGPSELGTLGGALCPLLGGVCVECVCNDTVYCPLLGGLSSFRVRPLLMDVSLFFVGGLSSLEVGWEVLPLSELVSFIGGTVPQFMELAYKACLIICCRWVSC